MANPNPNLQVDATDEEKGGREVWYGPFEGLETTAW